MSIESRGTDVAEGRGLIGSLFGKPRAGAPAVGRTRDEEPTFGGRAALMPATGAATVEDEVRGPGAGPAIAPVKGRFDPWPGRGARAGEDDPGGAEAPLDGLEDGIADVLRMGVVPTVVAVDDADAPARAVEAAPPARPPAPLPRAAAPPAPPSPPGGDDEVDDILGDSTAGRAHELISSSMDRFFGRFERLVVHARGLRDDLATARARLVDSEAVRGRLVDDAATRDGELAATRADLDASRRREAALTMERDAARSEAEDEAAGRAEAEGRLKELSEGMDRLLGRGR